MTLSRRDVAKQLLAATAFAAAGGRAVAATARPARRVPYGAAVALDDLRADPRLGTAIAGLCDSIVAVSEMKWNELRPRPGEFEFDRADELAAFARANGLAMRGHTLVWYAAMPDWTQDIASAAEAERVLTTHIQTVMTRYRGTIHSWDVVNEPIPDAARGVSDRRPTIWSRHLGERYLALAFRLAAEVDPQAELVLNEYDIEFGDARCKLKRAAFRDLVLRLLDAGAPLKAIGLQCHLRGPMAIDTDGLSAFVAEMRGLGLKCLVTELDVIDQKLPGPPAALDRAVAGKVNDLLTAAAAGGPLQSITTWGLSDRYSWVPYSYPRDDGLRNRPLPLDAEFRRKPFMDIVDRFTA
jgi:endo-1,4-beta-xylanase